jgi:hypothetical protein
VPRFLPTFAVRDFVPRDTGTHRAGAAGAGAAARRQRVKERAGARRNPVAGSL